MAGTRPRGVRDAAAPARLPPAACPLAGLRSRTGVARGSRGVGTGEPADGLRAPSPGRALAALPGAISGASPAPARGRETLLLPVQAGARVGSSLRRRSALGAQPSMRAR